LRGIFDDGRDGVDDAMASLLKVAAVLVMSVAIPLASPAYGVEQASPDDTARFLAGMHPSPQSPLAPLTRERSWQQHADTLDAIWAGLDAHQLSKIRAWSQANLTARKPVTYYLFSGPDFLYVDAFLPNSSTYILAGLEPAGHLPDVMKLRPRSVAAELTKLRTSLGTLLKMSYFITSEMSADLSASQLRGTLPLLYVFLARTGKTIHEVSFVDLAHDGSMQSATDAKSGARGIRIVFSGNGAKPQTLYYFKTDLSNRGVRTSGFLQFCAQFGVGDIFIKAASYLLHNAGFSTVRDFLLGSGASIVQDDTGIPVKDFQKAGWELRPFGRYVGPIPMFSGNYQSKLKDLFAQGEPAPIDFGIGYRWRTNQSHVLLAVNKNSSSAAIGRPAVQPKKSAAKKHAAPVRAASPEVSPLAKWGSLLMGGLITEALVSLFGLQGLANALGFFLQTTAVGGVAWLISSYFRNRSAQQLV
jgi:hypothetical protein